MVLPSKKVITSFVVQKKGGAPVKVYLTPDKGKPGWTISWVSAQGRERKWRRSRRAAKELAGTISTQLMRGQTKVASVEQIARLHRAEQLIKPFGVSIEFVAADWVENTRRLKGVPLSTAVADYSSRKVTMVLPVADAIKAFLKAKEQDGIGDRHAEDLKARLERFSQENPGSADKLTPEKLDRWLRGLRKIDQSGKLSGPLGPQTRNHYRAALLNFCHFAHKQRWLSFGPEEFAAFEPAAVERGDIEIFTPIEAHKIILGAAAELRAALILGFFSGLRPSEVLRVKWEDVDLGQAHIYVRGKTRTARHRIAFIPSNAVLWLESLKGHGKVCGYWHPGDAGSDVAEREGVRWIHDGPRHSYVSYRLAIVGDLGKVSEETGTDPETLRKHYRRPIPRAVAEDYFNLLP